MLLDLLRSFSTGLCGKHKEDLSGVAASAPMGVVGVDPG